MPSSNPLEQVAIEEMLQQINSEATGLSLDEDVLHDTRLSLLRLRNSSRTLAQINTLPLEVLTNIIRLSKTYRVHEIEDKRNLNAIAEVDTLWRQIALNIPNMWTHIDINFCTPIRNRYSLARLLPDRSKESLVHLHIFEPRGMPPHQSTPRLEIIWLAEFVVPHLPRASSLDLDTRSLSKDLTSFILQHWLNKGSHLLRALYIHWPNARELLRPENGDHQWVAPITASEDQSNVLLPLKTLHLQGAMFGWNSPAYCNLVDLRLDAGSPFVFFSIPLAQLAGILSASPKLVTLKLARAEVTNLEGYRLSAPIELCNLQILKLEMTTADSLKLVLLLIAQPNSAAHLSVGLKLETDVMDELNAFLLRSCVATLHLGSGVVLGIGSGVLTTDWKPPVSLPHLMVGGPEIRTSQSLNAQEAQKQPSVALHPTLLATLILYKFTLEELVWLVTNYRIQTLRLDN
ncbi:hypothetical protein FRC07_003307, partial [Ceratobasidium sp. 392]